MREIEFRGKAIGDGVWVYGDLHTRSKNPHIHDTLGRRVYINTATVGQYTGLRDKHDKKIYEGDILSDGEVKYEVWYSDDKGGFIAEMRDPQNDLVDYLGCYDTERYMDVIGNVHDNPDLIKQ